MKERKIPANFQLIILRLFELLSCGAELNVENLRSFVSLSLRSLKERKTEK